MMFTSIFRKEGRDMRKVVSISSAYDSYGNDGIYALCDDGTIWVGTQVEGESWQWLPVPGIPD